MTGDDDTTEVGNILNEMLAMIEKHRLEQVALERILSILIAEYSINATNRDAAYGRLFSMLKMTADEVARDGNDNFKEVVNRVLESAGTAFDILKKDQ